MVWGEMCQMTLTAQCYLLSDLCVLISALALLPAPGQCQLIPVITLAALMAHITSPRTSPQPLIGQLDPGLASDWLTAPGCYSSHTER